MIVQLLSQVDAISQGFVMQGYQNLVSAYTPAITGLIVLAIISFGYAVSAGWVDLNQGELIKRSMMVGIVIALALNWATFSQTVYTLFTNAPNEIAGHLLAAIPNVSFNTTVSGNAALDQAWKQGVGYSMAVWNQGGPTSLYPYIWAFLMLILVVLFVGLALIDLIVAKFGLAIFLVLSPLVIPTLLFKATKEALFDGWLKHLIAFALVPIFVYCALALSLALLGSETQAIEAAIAANQITMTTVAPYGIYSLIALGLLIKATGMAASIANGFSAGAGHWLGQKAENLMAKTMQGDGQKNDRPSEPQDDAKATNETTPST